MTPRGIRNNNPGNIRHSSINWLGQSWPQTDPDFVTFDDAEHGIRAMARILKTYARENVTTIREAINRWSPPTENDTSAYVTDVCAQCQLQPDQTIDLTAILPQVIKAIIQHENGEQPYTDQQINYGIALA